MARRTCVLLHELTRELNKNIGETINELGEREGSAAAFGEGSSSGSDADPSQKIIAQAKSAQDVSMYYTCLYVAVTIYWGKAIKGICEEATSMKTKVKSDFWIRCQVSLRIGGFLRGS